MVRIIAKPGSMPISDAGVATKNYMYMYTCTGRQENNICLQYMSKDESYW